MCFLWTFLTFVIISKHTCSISISPLPLKRSLLNWKCKTVFVANKIKYNRTITRGLISENDWNPNFLMVSIICCKLDVFNAIVVQFSCYRAIFERFWAIIQKLYQRVQIFNACWLSECIWKTSFLTMFDHLKSRPVRILDIH